MANKMRKQISISPNVYDKGIERAEELGFDFSSYLSYLINLDYTYEGLEKKIGNVEIVRKPKKEKEVKKDKQLSFEVKNSLDSIIGV